MSVTTSEILLEICYVGNHDTILGGLGRLRGLLRPGRDGLAVRHELWQRIDAGNVHFLMSDLEWSAESFTAEQGAWLAKAAGQHPER